MKYILNFNSNGKFEGWQDVSWTLDDDRMWLSESQYYRNGEFVQSTLAVFDSKTCEQYNFRDCDWGTVENARDAAEQAAMGWSNFVIVNEGYGSLVCKPHNEGVYVLS